MIYCILLYIIIPILFAYSSPPFEFLQTDDSGMVFLCLTGAIGIIKHFINIQHNQYQHFIYHVQNAKHNSELNSFKIPYYNTNTTILNHSFDIVCANILSNVLIDLSTELRSFTRKKLILSGILLDQIDKVIKVFSDWIELKHFSEKEGWVLLYGELES